MKILFILGARSEWGYIRPIIDLAQTRGHQCMIWSCNMSTLSRFGSLVDQIENEGYKIVGKFQTSVDGDNRVAMARSLGLTVLSASDWLANNEVDWVIVAGDRVEQIAVTLAAAILYIPVAHIQAGERSGNIDGVTRHAIARYAHLHFAANQDAVDRLIKSGESKSRVFLTGAPQLDEIVLAQLPHVDELQSRGIIDQPEFVLAVLHGTTEEDGFYSENIKVLVDTLTKHEKSIVWIASNNDNEKQIIESEIRKSLRASDKFHTNLNRIDYLGLLQNCKYLIGNSSSGILEAPSFGKPAINLGRRQDLRLRGENVIDSNFDEVQIQNCIKEANSKEFRDSLSNSINPYGDGKSSERIISILEQTEVNPNFLIKQISY